MYKILSLLESIIFLALAIIHFNWVAGNKWGFDEALPTNERGERVLNPKKIDSAIVGFGLLLFCVFYFFKSSIVDLHLPALVLNYAGWVISTIFIVRAIGDFKYIGFFKKVKQTPFAKMDTKVYSPLCLFLGVVGILLELKDLI